VCVCVCVCVCARARPRACVRACVCVPRLQFQSCSNCEVQHCYISYRLCKPSMRCSRPCRWAAHKAMIHRLRTARRQRTTAPAPYPRHVVCACALSLPTARPMHPCRRGGGGSVCACACVCVRVCATAVAVPRARLSSVTLVDCMAKEVSQFAWDQRTPGATSRGRASEPKHPAHARGRWR